MDELIMLVELMLECMQLRQIFDFSSRDHREINQWLKGLNSLLPNDISVSSIQKVPDDFHSRFDAINRSYAYIIYTGKTQPIFLRDYVYWEKNEIDLRNYES